MIRRAAGPYERDQIAESADQQSVLGSETVTVPFLNEFSIPWPLTGEANLLVKYGAIERPQLEGFDRRLERGHDEISQWSALGIGKINFQRHCVSARTAGRQHCARLPYRFGIRNRDSCRHRLRIQRGHEVLRQVWKTVNVIGRTFLAAASQQKQTNNVSHNERADSVFHGLMIEATLRIGNTLIVRRNCLLTTISPSRWERDE